MGAPSSSVDRGHGWQAALSYAALRHRDCPLQNVVGAGHVVVSDVPRRPLDSNRRERQACFKLPPASMLRWNWKFDCDILASPRMAMSKLSNI